MPYKLDDLSPTITIIMLPVRSRLSLVILYASLALELALIFSGKISKGIAAWISFCLALSARHYLWTLVGQDVIEISNHTVTIKRELRLLKQAIAWKKYIFSDDYIPQLFYVPPKSKGESYEPSGIGFKLGEKTYRYGDGLTAQEVFEIVSLIRNRCPRTADSWGQVMSAPMIEPQ